MRESTIKLEFDLEHIGATAAPAIVLTGAGITKSPKAGDDTVILTDATDPGWTATPVVYAAGGKLLINGTGWRSLDGKLVQIKSVDATAHSITIAVDTSAETAALPATLTDIKITAPTWDHVCLSEFSSQPGAPGEVDATTMCDAERVTLPGLPSAGTASFTGMFDLDDKGMLALQAAYEDGKPRWLVAKTRRGQQAMFHGVVSAFTMGSLGVEQAVTFTGSFTLDRTPSYAKAVV